MHRKICADGVTRVPGVHCRDGNHGDVACEDIAEQSEADVPVTAAWEDHCIHAHVAARREHVIKRAVLSRYLHLFPISSYYARDTTISGF